MKSEDARYALALIAMSTVLVAPIIEILKSVGVLK
jgi:hypothetical protein